jgi:hypothetical protein
MSWREPQTGAWSIYPAPGDFSTDNGVLFTVVAEQLDLIEALESMRIVELYRDPKTGFILRHPSTMDFSSWDDHLAAAISSTELAKDLYCDLSEKDWALPGGNWIGRIPLLAPTVRACAGLKLGVFHRIMAVGAYLGNLFEAREESSGKQLLWLASRSLHAQGGIVARVIDLWRWRMMRVYPGGLRELMAIYYTNPEHPFRAAARADFL